MDRINSSLELDLPNEIAETATWCLSVVRIVKAALPASFSVYFRVHAVILFWSF